MTGLRAAVGFLTPVPAGGGVPDQRAVPWFAVVGAAIGLLVGGCWWAAGEVLPVLVAAGLAVLADALLTGALHLDGLADSADGLLTHAEGAERRRAIMAAPDVGAFGVAALVVVLLLRWSGFASIEPDVLLVAGLWAAARGAMAAALVVVPYVGGGLGAAFLGAARGPVLLVGAALPLGAALASSRPSAAAAAVVAAWLAAAGVVAFGWRRLGGVTGDVLGAAGVVAETAGLVVAAARW